MPRRIRLLHIINSFEFGGAEAFLCNLALRTDPARFDISVAALIDDLSTAGPLQAAGVPIATMGMSAGIPDPRGILRLAGHVRRVRPDVIHTWMDHSNLIGSLAARLSSRAPVAWSIHHSHHVVGVTKRSTLLTVGACAKLSRRLPMRIVFCSDHGTKLYTEHGFDTSKMCVIPNGFDTARFRPDPAARAALRREIGVAADVPLLGLIARFDPLKGHATFLKAAAAVAQKIPAARFLLAGANVDPRNADLMALVDSQNLRGRCHLLGARRDVPRLYSALDVVASSSISEAFPLVVGEAMACGVPCAVTDVGDSAKIVGPAGRVVPPSDPAALAAACIDLLTLSPHARREISTAARRRVCDNFDLTAIARQYETLYGDMLGLQPKVSTDSFSRLACEPRQSAPLHLPISTPVTALAS